MPLTSHRRLVVSATMIAALAAGVAPATGASAADAPATTRQASAA
ncbi:peptidase M15, partial [Streptomyces sp. SID2131]|nr:peptidase M15 [Streptomyces sp. SID2131]